MQWIIPHDSQDQGLVNGGNLQKQGMEISERPKDAFVVRVEILHWGIQLSGDAAPESRWTLANPYLGTARMTDCSFGSYL